MKHNNTSVFFVMGVSGSGKSTIGKLLATELNIPFLDGDDYHPEANVIKMKNGNSLNDDDRHGWLLKLNELAKENLTKGVVIVCSALKEKYRILLSQDIEKVTSFVFLEGSFDNIMNRIKKRKGHFMPSSLLQSQFDTLEVPKDAITVSIMHTPEEIISEIVTKLNEKEASK